MESGTSRQGALTGLLDWLYEEFKDDLPSFVRLPVHLALAVATHAKGGDSETSELLETVTPEQIASAIEHSKLASEYARLGERKTDAVHDAVRKLHGVFHDGIESLHAEMAGLRAQMSLDHDDIRFMSWRTLDELRRIMGELRGRLDPSQPHVPTPPRNLPPRNEKFVGRDDELGAIHKLLAERKDVGVTQQTAVHGIGGVGKTATAQEYAWRHLDDYPGGVFKVSADTDLLLPAIAALAEPLGLPEEDNAERAAAAVKRRLEAGAASLLILDNVRSREQWNDAKWSACLPAEGCRRLVTTRSDHLSANLAMYALPRLPRDQGVGLLSRYRPDAADPANETLVGNVVDWFDGLAVGLTVVGVYMAMSRNRDVTWQEYADSLEGKGLGAVRAAEDRAGRLPDYDGRVDAIFDETYDALPLPERRALDYAALLPEDTVVRPWLAWLLEYDEQVELDLDPGHERDPARPVIASLVARQLLVPVQGQEAILALHRVLRRRLQERLRDDGDRREALLDGICELAEERGKASHEALIDKSIRWELSALGALSDALDHHGRVDAAVSLANYVHTPLMYLGRYDEARKRLGRFVDRGQNVVSSLEPARQAPLLSNLAMTLQDLGELGEARRHMERAIEMKEKHFEPDHPDLAIVHSNLAMILQDLGELPEARRHMERAIEIKEKHFEPDDPTMATSHSNLAAILQDLGELPEARRHVERAIEMKEKHFGPDHPDLAIVHSNLAMILQDLGELPEARRHIERAIEIGQQHFEPDHPSLATRYSNLACIAKDEGKLEDACRLWRRAYAIRTKHFSDDHPHVKQVVEALEHFCGGVGDASETSACGG